MEAARQTTGRPKGTGARFVRVEGRHGGTLRLTPCGADVGYAVSRPKNGMPRMTIGQDALEALRLDMRRYDARIEAGAVVADV